MGKQKTTLADMVKLTGVSVATISRAINKSGYVSEKNMKLIEEAQRELNYYPAKRHTNNRSAPNVILLCLPDNRSPFWQDFLSGIQEVCARRKYYPMLVYTKTTEAEEISIVKATERMHVSGLMVVTLNASHTLCSVFNNIALPKVLCAVYPIEDTEFQHNYDRVSVDSKRGIFVSTKHLIEQGCRSIAYIGTKTHLLNGRARLDGYLNALQHSYLQPDQNLICLKEDWECEENGYESVYRFYKSNTMPDGIACVNDRAAVGAMKACHELGISIPEQVKIVGMDNTDISNYVTPTLSSVDIAPHELARLSIELLFNRIDKSDALYQNNILMPNLVVRESSAKKQ